MNIQYEKEQLTEVINQVAYKTMNMDMVWDWPCGVAYFGICEAFRVTEKEEYLEFLKNRTDDYIALGLPAWTINTCAMGHAMMTLYEITKEDKYLDIVMSKVDYIQNHAPRFGEHVLQHTVSANNDFPEQAWADTLFMAAFFLLRVGIILEDRRMIEDALNQYYWHIQYLQDPASGLWYHGYSNIKKDHMSGFFWGRANAWAAFTMSQVGQRLPKPYLYPVYMDIDCSLRDQLSALKLYQTANGLWRTLIEDEQSYEEVSASCGIAAAMIHNGNPLHTGYVQRALEGILKNISVDGRVLNVSGGTAVMNDREGYCNISRTWIQGWGQGFALAFLAAVFETNGI